MRVPTFEARNRLSALLAEVARGVEVTITRRGVPVAKLVPATPGFGRDKVLRAVAGLRAASRGAMLGGIGAPPGSCSFGWFWGSRASVAEGICIGSST